eukprot:51543_1
MEQSLLELLKEKSNILNGKFQKFQADLKHITQQIISSEITNENKSTYTQQMNKLCDNYSSSINRLEIEYLIKCEQHFENTNRNTNSNNINENPKFSKYKQNTNIEKKPKSIMKIEKKKQSKSFKCEECNITYAAKSSLLRHNRKNHPKYDNNTDTSSSSSDSELKHKCSKCDKICSSIYCLRKHMSREHSCKHQCKTCLKTFKNAQALGGHMTAHRNKRPFKCKQCQSDFQQHRYLVQHIVNVHKQNPWECNKCDKVFRYKRKLNEHKKLTHENNSNSKIISSDENETNDNDNDNDIHSSTYNVSDSDDNNDSIVHTQHQDSDIEEISIRFGCNLCEKGFDNKLELNKHRNNIHGKINPNPFKCDMCNQLYASAIGLRMHKMKRHDEKMYKCKMENCIASFKEERYLIQHIKDVHKDEMFEKKLDVSQDKQLMHNLVDNKELNESSDSGKISVGNEEDLCKKETSVKSNSSNKRTKSLYNRRL